MKIRTGFVSNSSSSSFVCNVCGAAESGMDMSASDFEMTECVNGHTFCDCHADRMKKPDSDAIRENIRNQIKDHKYMEAEEKERAYRDLDDTIDEDLEDLLQNSYSEEGVAECLCPVCSFLAITPSDGFTYLKKVNSTSDKEILTVLKNQFKSYKEFVKFLEKK